MEHEEKVMTGEESLKIITEMINKTKVSISQGSFHLLFWGWLIFICSLSEYCLYRFTNLSNTLVRLVSCYSGCFRINDLRVCKREERNCPHLC